MTGNLRAGPQVKQRPRNWNKPTKKAGSQKVQYPGGTKKQFGLSVDRFPLQRTEEGEQDLADFEDTDIDSFFKALRNRIEPDELRSEQRAEQIAIRLPGNQTSRLRHHLPRAKSRKLPDRTAMEGRNADPIAEQSTPEY